MSISYVAAGTVAVGTTSVVPGMPAGVSNGDLLVLCVANKYPPNAPSTPSGWTLHGDAKVQGGTGGTCVDAGDVFCYVFYRVRDGSEGATVTVSIGSGNSAVARIFAYRASTSGATWNVQFDNGSDAGPDTNWSIMGSLTLDVAAGDWIVCASAINTDNYTFSGHSMSGDGSVTYGSMTERQDSGTTNGDDCALVVADCSATSGSNPNDLPTYSATASGSSGLAPCGAGVLVRIREVQPASAVDPLGMMGFFGV